MVTYSQRLQDYNRYARTPQMTKSAKVSSEDAARRLWDTMSADAQRDYMNAWRDSRGNYLAADPTFILARAYSKPQLYSGVMGLMGSSALQWAGGGDQKNNILSADGFESIRKAVVENIEGTPVVRRAARLAVKYNIPLPQKIIGWASRFVMPKGSVAINADGSLQDSLPPKPEDPYKPPMNTKNFDYMLPALAVGIPAAALSSLTGNSRMGGGILGAAALGGLGYGIARANGWKGFKPVEEAASTINATIFGDTSKKTTAPKAPTAPSPTPLS